MVGPLDARMSDQLGSVLTRYENVLEDRFLLNIDEADIASDEISRDPLGGSKVRCVFADPREAT